VAWTTQDLWQITATGNWYFSRNHWSVITAMLEHLLN